MYTVYVSKVGQVLLTDLVLGFNSALSPLYLQQLWSMDTVLPVALPSTGTENCEMACITASLNTETILIAGV